MSGINAADKVRSYVRKQYIEPARKKGQKRIRIVAGDVHRALDFKNRVPNVCNALTSKTLLRENHLVIEEQDGPPSGMGTRMTYTYRLLDDKETLGTQPDAHAFENLRGLLAEAFKPLGGGEAFLRRERSRFYQSDGAESK